MPEDTISNIVKTLAEIGTGLNKVANNCVKTLATEVSNELTEQQQPKPNSPKGP